MPPDVEDEHDVRLTLPCEPTKISVSSANAGVPHSSVTEMPTQSPCSVDDRSAWFFLEFFFSACMTVLSPPPRVARECRK
jgi:hypothetical protein